MKKRDMYLWYVSRFFRAEPGYETARHAGTGRGRRREYPERIDGNAYRPSPESGIKLNSEPA